jgi:hypothetical protein
MPGPSGLAGGFPAGSRVAGYRLGKQIGHGGMAVVFLAQDERLGRQVALKVLSPALAADESFRHRFIRESRSAAAVDHPHIIPVFEAGEADGTLFIAMRYVPGGDAGTLVSRFGPMPRARAAAMIAAVASALDAAHGAGLVHRDVKPGNILVDRRPGQPDHVYLSDFGLTKGMSSSAGLTGMGYFIGTLDYCAPEQIEGKHVDARTDEYALACAAFQLLTGAPPFPRDEGTAVLYAQLSAEPPELTSRRPDLPPAADGVLARALAKDSGHRYASCGEFAAALAAAFGLRGHEPGSGEPDHPPTELAWSGGSAGEETRPAQGAVPLQTLPGGPARAGRNRVRALTAVATVAAVSAITVILIMTHPGTRPAIAGHLAAASSISAGSSTVARPASAQQPGASGYEEYTNPHYGFTVLWPSFLRAQPPQEGGSGQSWSSADGQVLLSAYGTSNLFGYSPQQDETADAQSMSVVYENISGNIVTVSGYIDNGNTIVYRRDVVGTGFIDTLYWRYPTSKKAQFDAAVTLTAHTFQPGDVTTAH